MSRRTLVDLLKRDIAHAEPYELDWTLEVRLACDRHDMQWELDYWDEVNRRATGPAPAGSRTH